MKKTVKASFVVDKELWEKFKKIAEYEVRSNSREVARAVRFYVQNFEKEHKIDP